MAMKKKDSGKISTRELAAGCILLYELLPDKFTFREAKQIAEANGYGNCQNGINATILKRWTGSAHIFG